MKQGKRLLMVAAALCLMLAAGCKAAPAQTQAAGVQPRGGMARPDDGSVMGVITTVSADSITIAQMPQGGDGQRPQGTPPADGGQRKPDGTPPAGGGAPDTSGWEKSTWAIDGNTRIVQTQQDGAEKTMAAADLKAGDNVTVKASGSDKSTAAVITVMAGMGAMPDGQQQGGARN